MLKVVKIVLTVLLVVCAMVFSFGAGIGMAPRFTQVQASANGAQALPKQFGLLGEVWNVLEEDYVDKSLLDPQKLAVGAINGTLEALADPHSAYIDAEQNRLRKTAFRGAFDGIGAEVTNENKDVVILAPISGSPADQAGIKPGDRILAVNGESTEGLNLNDVVTKIRGPRGTKVKITLMHKGESNPYDVEITRAEVQTKTVAAQMLPQNGIAYVRITYFSERTASELQDALKQMKAAGAKAILLDLRNNPGGLLDSAVDVSSQFLKSGLVLTEVDADGKTTAYPVKPGGLVTDLPVAVLVNKSSASGSEVVAGALQDNGSAVIGMVTTGKGSINRLRELSDGSALYVTFARWLTPKGRLIEGKGLSPDIVVDMTEDDAKAQKDPQLDKGLQYLQSKLGLAPQAQPGLSADLRGLSMVDGA